MHSLHLAAQGVKTCSVETPETVNGSSSIHLQSVCALPPGLMKAQRLEPTSKKRRKITEFLINRTHLSKQVCYTQAWVPQNLFAQNTCCALRIYRNAGFSLKFRRVTTQGAQPSGRLSEESCLSEGSVRVSQRALRGSLRGFCGAPRDFPRFFGGGDPTQRTLPY